MMHSSSDGVKDENLFGGFHRLMLRQNQRLLQIPHPLLDGYEFQMRDCHGGLLIIGKLAIRLVRVSSFCSGMLILAVAANLGTLRSEPPPAFQ
jgi:hypothetical protein